MLRKTLISLVLILLLLGGAGALTYQLIATRPAPPTADTARPILTVRAIRVAPQTTVEPIVGFGTARADQEAMLTAEVAGPVIELARNLRIGATIAAGDMLVRIDPREYEAALERARSQLRAERAGLQQLEAEVQNLDALLSIGQEELALSERELNRVRVLLEQGSSTPREADQARLAFQQARRTLQLLENQRRMLPERRAQQEALIALREAEAAVAALNLERTTVTAPFDGRLTAVEVELGERVGPGEPLVGLVNPDLIEVPLELPLSLRQRVRPDAPVSLRLESGPEVAWEGHLARISPQADRETRTFAAFVEVDNRAQTPPLMPGMFVQAEMAGPTLENVLIVPRGAIQDGQVFVVREGKAYPVAVEVERRLLDRSVVRGLSPGDVVITSNLDALQPGLPVEVMLTNAAPAAPVAAADAADAAEAAPPQAALPNSIP